MQKEESALILSKIKNLYNLSAFLSKILHCNKYAIIYFIFRIRFDLIFWHGIENRIRQAQKKVNNDKKFGGWIDIDAACVIYASIRIANPKIIIETGVGPGMSSSIILKAIFDNKNKGKLYSIDLPGYDSEYYSKIGKNYNIHFAGQDGPGWLVDKKYVSNWEFIIGDSKDKLPELLKKINSVDVFVHDSLHSDEHINFELNTILPYMSSIALFFCDDVNEEWSEEFVRFAKKESLNYLIFRKRLGIGAIDGKKII